MLARTVGHPLRVALDGPEAAAPTELGHRVAARLVADGRAAAVVATCGFWRDASLRLEYGRTDQQAYREDWLDAAALEREVLRPLGPGGDRSYLPALRDPLSNRSVRTTRHPMPEDGVLLVAGEFLLGRGLGFDLTIHLALDAAARARRTPSDTAWTLPAWAAYDAEVHPLDVADLVVRWNDPDRPALSY